MALAPATPNVMKMNRTLLIVIWAVAVVPVVLLCAMTIVMGVGIGWDTPHRSNWPQYLSLLCLPVLAATASTMLSWLSVRLWSRPKWRHAAFPMAFSYYAIVGLIVWAVIDKHWIQ